MAKEVERKKWSVRTVGGTEGLKDVQFHPTFLVDEAAALAKGVNISEGEVECRYVDITVDDKTYRFNYLDLYMFTYFCANEELRQRLQQHYERKVEYIPYEVDFALTEDEKKRGVVTRRIELPVDDVAMAYAKDISVKYLNKDIWKKKK